MKRMSRFALLTFAAYLTFAANLTAQTIITIAGGGTDEGRPALASGLVTPSGLAVDKSGNIYIAESYRGRVRKVDAATGLVTTVASGLSLDAHAGLAVDDSGNVYVGETASHRVIRVAAGGARTTLIEDIIAPAIAADASGIYIADSTRNRVLRIDPASGVIATVAGRGEGQAGDGDLGPATAANLSNPISLALDRSSNLFIVDFGNHRIRRVDAVTGIITTVAGTGGFETSGDNGPARAAGLAGPIAVTVDAGGNLFIADHKDHRIRRVDAATNVIAPIAGKGAPSYGGDHGPAREAALSTPHGVVVDRSGNLLILDSGNHRIRRIAASSGVITTAVGGPSGDGGPATAAVLNAISGIAVDAAKNVYLSDAAANRVAKIAAGTRIITTFAGGAGAFFGDGGPAVGAGLNPRGLAIDRRGNVYIADSSNKRIRRVDAAGRSIDSIGDPSRFPIGVAVDASEDLYTSDAVEDAIRKINAATGSTTILALELAIDSAALAADASGNVYFAEPERHRVRKLSVGGVIATVAGTSSVAGFAGDGAPAVNARLNRPSGIATDRAGNLYIADTANHRIRRVDALTGIITTIAGNGSRGFAGDHGLATAAMLNEPSSLALDGAGVLYIGDSGNERIRAVVPGVPRRRAITR